MASSAACCTDMTIAPKLVAKAAKDGKVDIVEAWLRDGGDAAAHDYEESDYPLLMKAASTGQVKIVELLLRHKASADLKASKGFTTLELCAMG